MRTIAIQITAEDTTEVLEILSWISNEIEAEKIEEIDDYTISGIESIAETEEEYCYPDCEDDKKNCSCFQEKLGCDKYHQKKEDGLL